MARRIRSIKPEILDDEKTASLSHLDWRLFVSIWLMADNFGNLRGQPVQIKGAALWASSDSSDDVAQALDRLCAVGLLRNYTVGGQRYLSVAGWSKHQLIKNPGKPLVPGPETTGVIHGSTEDEDTGDEVRRVSGNLPDAVRSSLDLDHEQRPTTNDQVLRDKPRATKSDRSKPKCLLPDDWQPSPEAIARAQGAGLDVNREAERFRNHAAQNDRKCANWNAAFANWLISAEERKAGGGGRPTNSRDLLEWQLQRVREAEEAEARGEE